MRRIVYFAKAMAAVLASVACAALLLVLCNAPVFGGGEGYEVYYGHSSSSPVKFTRSPLWEKLGGGVCGESARFGGDRYEELKERFHAELLFREEADGIVNYYLYSPDLGGGVLLCGYLVNLHIAAGEGTTVAGTPLIFGGY